MHACIAQHLPVLVPADHNGPLRNLTSTFIGDELLRLAESGLVTLIEINFPYFYIRMRHFVQPVALMSCLQRYRTATHRFMFLDLDEYIFLGPLTLALQPPRTLLSWMRERERSQVRGANVVALTCHRLFSLPALLPRIVPSAFSPDGSLRLDWIVQGQITTTEFNFAPSKYIVLTDAARNVGVHYMHEP